MNGTILLAGATGTQGAAGLTGTASPASQRAH